MIQIHNFQATPECLYISLTRDGVENKFSFPVNGKFRFKVTEDQLPFYRDICVLNALDACCFYPGAIRVEEEVSEYLFEHYKEHWNTLTGWVNFFTTQKSQEYNVWFPHPKDSGHSIVRKEPIIGNAILAYSGGKESRVSKYILDDLGLNVKTFTIDKPFSVDPNSLFSYGTEEYNLFEDYVTDNLFRDRLMYVQGAFLTVLPALMCAAYWDDHPSYLLAMGSEFGCSYEWEIDGTKIHDLPTDEGLASARFTEGLLWYHGFHTKVRSPVASLPEAALVRIIHERGELTQLETCWEQETINQGEPCEHCLKCLRMKYLMKYLVHKGHITKKDYLSYFRDWNQPGIHDPATISYSIQSEPIYKDIIFLPSPNIDWSQTFVYSKAIEEFSGLGCLNWCMENSSQGIHEKNVTPKEPHLNPHTLPWARQEIETYLDIDYTEFADDPTEIVNTADFELPFEEYFLYSESVPCGDELRCTRVMQHFLFWPVYDHPTQGNKSLFIQLEPCEKVLPVQRLTEDHIGEHFHHPLFQIAFQYKRLVWWLQKNEISWSGPYTEEHVRDHLKTKSHPTL